MNLVRKFKFYLREHKYDMVVLKVTLNGLICNMISSGLEHVTREAQHSFDMIIV